ncbi:MAG: hypothetical protein M1826_001590, partial [Phylliscum demangeonii]
MIELKDKFFLKRIMRFTVLIAVALLSFAPALTTPAKLQRRDLIPWMRAMVEWTDCLNDCMIEKLKRISLITQQGTEFNDLWESCLVPKPHGCDQAPPGGADLDPTVYVDAVRLQVQITTLAGHVFRSVSNHFHRALWAHGPSAAMATIFKPYIPWLERAI